MGQLERVVIAAQICAVRVKTDRREVRHRNRLASEAHPHNAAP
jgi:hypothetical protein